MAEWIEQYGYLALFAGTFLEGEIVLISGILAAKAGLLNVIIAPLVVFVGAYIIDNIWFFVGRSKGRPWLMRQRRFSKKIGFVDRSFDKYPDRILLSYRFLIGFRTIVPLLAGISRIHIKGWLTYSFISVFLWTLLYSVLGYIFEKIILDGIYAVQNNVERIVITLLIAAGVIGIYRLVRYRIFPK